MTNAPDDTRATDRLAARLLDAEKEVSDAATALRDFVRAGERYSTSSKSLDEAVVALEPVRSALQQAVTALGTAVSALQAGVQVLQGSDFVRLREELGARITAMDGGLDALRKQVASVVTEVQVQQDAGVTDVKGALAGVRQVLEDKLSDASMQVVKQAQEAVEQHARQLEQYQVQQREQQHESMASMSKALGEQGEAVRRVLARVEGSEARLTKQMLGGFAVVGAGLAVVAYRLLIN